MTPTNQEIARKLREHAAELARDGGNLYRVRAFRQAAMTVLALPEEVSALVAAAGPRALERLPGIGKSLADTIAGLADGAGRVVIPFTHPSRVRPGRLLDLRYDTVLVRPPLNPRVRRRV
jgi:Holliday junction DNA helicase RuvA